MANQKVTTPPLKDCYCGSKAQSVWMDYDNHQVHCIENDHRITAEMGSRHRAICRWNNTIDKGPIGIGGSIMNSKQKDSLSYAIKVPMNLIITEAYKVSHTKS